MCESEDKKVLLDKLYDMVPSLEDNITKKFITDIVMNNDKSNVEQEMLLTRYIHKNCTYYIGENGEVLDTDAELVGVVKEYDINGDVIDLYLFSELTDV